MCVCGGGDAVSSNFELPSFPLFCSFSFFICLSEGLILDGNSQRVVNPKQQTYQPIRKINSKITKSGRILE